MKTRLCKLEFYLLSRPSTLVEDSVTRQIKDSYRDNVTCPRTQGTPYLGKTFVL